jgi:dTDP-4-dehydrorhamnose reductase/UDP-glucose 4-epimerase
VARRLILGRGLIARAIAAAQSDEEALILPHTAVHAGSLPADIDAVLWGGRHPALGTSDWRLQDELELQAARLAAARGLPFLSLGTRKVYAPSHHPLRESDPIGPVDRYGDQKLRIESALLDILGERLTRLRLANLFGYEPGRSTFMGRMLTSLAKTGEIRFDMSPFTPRDFLPLDLGGAAIATLLRKPPGGIVNIGSGIPLECGRLALWLLQGHGEGQLVCESWEERDAFVLDVARLHRLTGWRCAIEDLRAACLRIGEAVGET